MNGTKAAKNTAEALAILIIDDDSGDRALCVRALKNAFGDGYRPLEADSGEKGLESLEKHRLDCVLLDYSLPGINGIDVLKRLRIRHPYLPVIIIDGKGNDVIAVQSMKEGAQDYIAKSMITSPIIQRAIRMAIEHSALQKRDHERRTLFQLFTRALAHDLREPVRNIGSFLNQIPDWRSLNANSQQSFRYICNSANRMSALIDAVQVYTGLDAADQMERASIDLADVLKQVQENLAQLIETREATITCDALPRVHANEAQMLQLLQNLVANAIWHRDSAVTIHVEAKDYGSQWLLTVQDDGPGIAPKNLEAIFDPFTRLSHHDDGAPGPGLGLAIIRKIVESYGGLIWCESHLGMGTCFLFTLPKMTAVVAVSSDDVVHIAPPSLLPASAHRYV